MTLIKLGEGRYLSLNLNYLALRDGCRKQQSAKQYEWNQMTY